MSQYSLQYVTNSDVTNSPRQNVIWVILATSRLCMNKKQYEITFFSAKLVWSLV